MTSNEPARSVEKATSSRELEFAVLVRGNGNAAAEMRHDEPQIAVFLAVLANKAFGDGFGVQRM